MDHLNCSNNKCFALVGIFSILRQILQPSRREREIMESIKEKQEENREKQFLKGKNRKRETQKEEVCQRKIRLMKEKKGERT